MGILCKNIRQFFIENTFDYIFDLSYISQDVLDIEIYDNSLKIMKEERCKEHDDLLNKLNIKKIFFILLFLNNFF